MKSIIYEMLEHYNSENQYERKNAFKEVVQEIILCGLSRAGFFDQCAFYGGTALRIFYGLDRFSEDLDFSLLDKNIEFDLSAYLPTLEREVNSYGLQMAVEKKEKTKDSAIQSAFLKGNTKEHFLLLYPMDTEIESIPKNELIKIKFEVDTNPPDYASFERKYRLNPVPYEVCLYDASSLFAGKIHAVLGRSWKNRVKGRDLYDYVFYRRKNISVNLPHLKGRLVQSGHLDRDEELDMSKLKEMLINRFREIDYKQAKEDVLPFIKDGNILELWSDAFFVSITEEL